MKQFLLGLIAGIVFLVVAFLPPVVAAAEQNENAHFGEHLLILLAGLLSGYATQILIRSQVILRLELTALANAITVLGLLLFVASMIPDLDALADATMAIHVLQHLVILVSGGLIGLGLFGHSTGLEPTSAARSH